MACKCLHVILKRLKATESFPWCYQRALHIRGCSRDSIKALSGSAFAGDGESKLALTAGVQLAQCV